MDARNRETLSMIRNHFRYIKSATSYLVTGVLFAVTCILKWLGRYDWTELMETLYSDGNLAY